MKQLKKETNKAEVKLHSLEIEIGRELAKKVAERETVQKLKKQEVLDKSIYSRPSTHFSHSIQNSTLLLKK
jgi:hypothetical protein